MGCWKRCGRPLIAHSWSSANIPFKAAVNICLSWLPIQFWKLWLVFLIFLSEVVHMLLASVFKDFCSEAIINLCFWSLVHCCFFIGHRPKCFWNDQKKLPVRHFSQNDWKYRLMNTYTVSFNTTVGQMTKTSQWKKKQFHCCRAGDVFLWQVMLFFLDLLIL